MARHPDHPPAEPRFVADAMLGRLARWLRLLGWDVAYDPGLGDRELARLAAREDRVLLTRDRGLLARRIVRRGLLVRDDGVGRQLAQVLRDLGLDPDPARAWTRCSLCNTPTEEVPKESVAGRVPAYTYATHERFRRCPGCGKVYWGGTHRALACADLVRWLGEGKAPGCGGDDPEKVP